MRWATSARAALAQSAEHLTRNEKVKGSIPLGGSISFTRPLPWNTQVSGIFLASTRPQMPPGVGRQLWFSARLTATLTATADSNAHGRRRTAAHDSGQSRLGPRSLSAEFIASDALFSVSGATCE